MSASSSRRCRCADFEGLKRGSCDKHRKLCKPLPTLSCCTPPTFPFRLSGDDRLSVVLRSTSLLPSIHCSCQMTVYFSETWRQVQLATPNRQATHLLGFCTSLHSKSVESSMDVFSSNPTSLLSLLPLTRSSVFHSLLLQPTFFSPFWILRFWTG